MRALIAIVGRYLPDPTTRAGLVEELSSLIDNGPDIPLGARRYG